jgi:hypothetical protein
VTRAITSGFFPAIGSLVIALELGSRFLGAQTGTTI